MPINKTRQSKDFRKPFHPSVTIYLARSFRDFVFGENMIFAPIQTAPDSNGQLLEHPQNVT